MKYTIQDLLMMIQNRIESIEKFKDQLSDKDIRTDLVIAENMEAIAYTYLGMLPPDYLSGKVNSLKITDEERSRMINLLIEFRFLKEDLPISRYIQMVSLQYKWLKLLIRVLSQALDSSQIN